MNSDSAFIYSAKFKNGEITFWKKNQIYCFIFFNGKDYTPLYLSKDAAYFVWMFISCEHPDAITNKTLSSMIGNKPSSSKKAGHSKAIKKRPSLAKKKK